MTNKQRVVLITDNSISMRSLAFAAKDDYNRIIRDIKDSSLSSGIETLLTVVKCGSSDISVGPYNPYVKLSRSLVSVAINNTNIHDVKQSFAYETTGRNTPLLDSIGRAIELMRAETDNNTPILIMGITDGQENASVKWNSDSIARDIRNLQKTGLWTFAFRCPQGYTSYLTNIGISRENILEWDQTTHGMEESSFRTQTAMREYYTARAAGATSSDRFYVDPSNLRVKDIKEANLSDVTTDVTFLTTGSLVTEIRPFIESMGHQYVAGHWYYELTKTETLQANKRIIIRNKNTRKIYAGEEARDLLKLPHGDSVKIVPQGISSTNYQIFVRSLSVNRKLMPNTMVCHYSR